MEGRQCNDKYSDLVIGDIIKLLKFENSSKTDMNDVEYILLRVTNITKYESFKKMLELETLPRVLPDPDICRIKNGVKVYRKFYTEKLEIKKGVLAITVEIVN